MRRRLYGNILNDCLQVLLVYWFNFCLLFHSFTLFGSRNKQCNSDNTHILLEQSLTYESCTVYSILLLFISIIITFLTYLGTDANLLPFTNTLFGIIVVNWFIPMAHCFIRNMFDYGSRIEKFNSFYRNVSIVFLLFYIGALLYLSFSDSPITSIYHTRSANNFTPFWWVATLIEDYINDMIPFSLM